MNMDFEEMNALLDYEHAEEVFEKYLDSYDQTNAKIMLKKIHTYGVVRYAKEISERMGLGTEDVQLAKLIGLLHDIGRFEQVARYDSFDRRTMSHAAYGTELLFGERMMIREFLPDERWDRIIRTAIARHSDYSIQDLKDEIYDQNGIRNEEAYRIYLHSALIRDADKLDNCRVKIEDRIEVLLGVHAEEAGAQCISDAVWQDCLEHRSVLSENRVNAVDHWVSYIAYFFDLNFKETWQIIEENHYIDRIIARIPYSCRDTEEKMYQLRDMLTEHNQNIY